jgi:outer membrane protein assembly factor BamB
VLWHRSLPGATYSPCASLGKDGEVYVSCVNYSALAFSGNGDMLWGFNTSRDNVAAVESSFPVVATDGTIYAPSVNGLLYALRPDGAVKWTFGGDGERTAWRNGVSLMGNGDLVFTHVSPGTSLIYGGGTNLTRLTAQGQVVWSRYSPISQSILVSALPSGYIAYDPPGTSFQFLDGNGTLAWEIIGMSSARYSRFGEGMAVASDGTIIAVSGQDIFAVAKGRPTELVQAGAQWQGTDVKINWQPNLNDGGSAISAYQIYRLPPGQSLVWHASESDMAMYLVGVVDGNSTSFIDRGAPNDDSTYLVAAKNSYGMGQLNQFYVEGSWDNGFSATMIALVIGVAVILVLILVLKRYYAD